MKTSSTIKVNLSTRLMIFSLLGMDLTYFMGYPFLSNNLNSFLFAFAFGLYCRQISQIFSFILTLFPPLVIALSFFFPFPVEIIAIFTFSFIISFIHSSTYCNLASFPESNSLSPLPWVSSSLTFLLDIIRTFFIFCLSLKFWWSSDFLCTVYTLSEKNHFVSRF